MKLSRAQKFIRFFTSKAMFEKMRIDSEKWKFTCKSCNATSSIWEIGGIRYKAVGDPVKGIRCPKCRTFGMQRLRYEG